MIAANDPSLRTWLEIPSDSDFPIQNLPFGIFKTTDLTHRVGVRIGDFVLDLSALEAHDFLNGLNFDSNDFNAQVLNTMMRKGKHSIRSLRNRISQLLDSTNTELQNNLAAREKLFIPITKVEMCMPIQVGDYTDFYSSREHATNVGKMFRDPENALLPNWLWIPVGYHGRASSVILSDQNVYRPKGQIKPNPNENPVFSPTKMLDFELETAFITFEGKALGDSIAVEEAADYIFGKVLLNDWSARDIQSWEYVPLGPFLSKNFASSISPWVVTLDALEPFKIAGPKQEPEVLSYLQIEGKNGYDISLEVYIQTPDKQENLIVESNFKYMYWNMMQQLAHHSVNGCNIRCGDLMGSGTISGQAPNSVGSLLELTWKGTKPITLKDGTERTFIADYDTVIMRGYCKNEKVRIGFGEVKAMVLPSK